MRLSGDRIDGFDEEVVVRQVEPRGSFRRIADVERRDGQIGIYLKKMFLQHIRLGTSYGFCRRRQLAIDVGGGHTVVIDYRQMSYARTYQRLGTPAANATNAKDDDAQARKCLDGICAEKKFRPSKRFLYRHGAYSTIRLGDIASMSANCKNQCYLCIYADIGEICGR